jgi:hypothetical protein
VKIGNNLRITLAGTAAALAIAAPVAQACYRPTPTSTPVDVCKLDVNALLAKYGSNLSDAQKQWVIDTATKLMAAKGCTTVTPVGPPVDQGPGYGV